MAQGPNIGTALAVKHSFIPGSRTYPEVTIKDLFFRIDYPPPKGVIWYWGAPALDIDGWWRPFIHRIGKDESQLIDWAPSPQAYVVGDYVAVSNVLYRCIVNHTASASPPGFAADLAGGKWGVIADNNSHDKWYSYVGSAGFRIFNCYAPRTADIKSVGGYIGTLAGHDPADPPGSNNPEGGAFTDYNAVDGVVGLRYAADDFQPGFQVKGRHINSRDNNVKIGGPVQIGTATAGGASTLTINAPFTPNVGDTIRLCGGPGFGQKRTVSGYSSGVVTVSVAWDTDTDAPGNGTRWVIEDTTTDAGASIAMIRDLESRINDDIDRTDGKHGIAYPTDFDLNSKGADVQGCRFGKDGPVWLNSHRRLIAVRYGPQSPNIIYGNSIDCAGQYFIYNPTPGTFIKEGLNDFSVGIIQPFFRGDFVSEGGFGFAAQSIHVGGACAKTATEGSDQVADPTLTYIGQLNVPFTVPMVGIRILNGSVVAGNVKLYLTDSLGNLLAQVNSTAQAGAASYQEIPFTVPYGAITGTYYVLAQFSNATARFRAHTYGSFGASRKIATTFGTFPTITPPSTFTTGSAPIASLC